MEKSERLNNKEILHYINQDHLGGYDSRDIDLSRLHNVSHEQINVILNLIPLQEHIKIADVGCGKGDLIEDILQYITSNHTKEYLITAIDNSWQQCQKVHNRFIDNLHIQVINDDITYLHHSQEYDIIIAKNVLHEMPLASQTKGIINLLKILKPNGKLIIWDFFLEESTEQIISKIIRKKDALCGYPLLVKNREFVSFPIFKDALERIHVTNIRIEFEYLYTFSSRQQMQYENKQDSLSILNSYIREVTESFDENIKSIEYFDNQDDDISFNMNGKILLYERGNK